MVNRTADAVLAALARAPVVALVGPRQVGKTTLALDLADAKKLPMERRFDLELAQDRAALSDPLAVFKALGPGLVVLDEVQYLPDLFQSLRHIVDQRRRQGHRVGQFLVLGSASLSLLQSASESLAGRIEVLELKPFDIEEVEPQERLFLRGGFPESFLAKSDADSFSWRTQFIQSYLERDIPLFAPRMPRETLRRFWTMLAHLQGQEYNAAQLARSLDISQPAIARYCDLLCDLYLLRRLPAYAANVGKRLKKSPKVYVRDSGLVHALLSIGTDTQLLAHPVLGGSFEGFAIEQLLGASPMANASFYRTSNGAEIDLVIEQGHHRIAIEVKRSAQNLPTRGFYTACEDIHATERWMVHTAERSFPHQGIQVMPLAKARMALKKLLNA
jgi:uncharacterized protein